MLSVKIIGLWILEKCLKVFKIYKMYRHCGHLGHVVISSFPKEAPIKFGFDWSSDFKDA